MQKKWIAGVLTAALMMTSMLPVYAAENQQSGTTTVTATVDSTYTMTIPAETKIPFNQVETKLNGQLKVKGNVKSSEEVYVTADANPLENEKNETISYVLKQGGAEFTNATWSEQELRAEKAYDLSVTIPQATWDTAKAGTYTGGIVFTAQLRDVAQP